MKDVTRSNRWIAGLVLVAATLLPSLAWAQEDGSTGWFDDNTSESAAGADEAADAAPEPEAAPPPAAPERKSAAPAQDTYSETDPAALTDFRPALDPNGTWYDDPTYGLVWVPHKSVVGTKFAPYLSNGHWGLTDNGEWIWVSNYSFGWVVFHYGRWTWVPQLGWAWIPGREYRPAWVQWRYSTSGTRYVGWAPLPPRYAWRSGVAVSIWYGSPTPWIFCPTTYVYYNNVDHYIVRTRLTLIANRSVRWRGRRGRYSPPPRRFGIPRRALPRRRVAANPTALAASRRSTAKRVIRPGARPKGRRVVMSPQRRRIEARRKARALANQSKSRAPRGGAARRPARSAPRASRAYRPSRRLGRTYGSTARRPAVRSVAPRRSAPGTRAAPPSRNARPPARTAPSRARTAPRAKPRPRPKATPRRTTTRRPTRSATRRTKRSTTSRSAPRRSPPSRSRSSRSAPSRSRSAPTRSAPTRSAPSRSRSAPSRSAPSRSAPRRSSPSRSRRR